jgi:hypothetical protein
VKYVFTIVHAILYHLQISDLQQTHPDSCPVLKMINGASRIFNLDMRLTWHADKTFPHDQPKRQSLDDNKVGIWLFLLLNYAIFKTSVFDRPVTCAGLCEHLCFRRLQSPFFYRLATRHWTCARCFETAWWCHLQGPKCLIKTI